MKVKILFARLCVSGSHRQEVGNTLIEVALASVHDPRIEDVNHMPIARVPTPVARNLVVQQARAQQADIIFMVDDDMWPAEGFFMAAVDFLLGHAGPAVIASPYCTAPPREDVTVFEWAQGASGKANAPFALVNVVREDAARRQGIEQVANCGTGYIAYKTEAFDRINHPYYDYSYEDKTHTKVTETEDCYNARKLYFAGVPLYVHWDFWSQHKKGCSVGKPQPMTHDQVGEYFMEKARVELTYGGKELAALVPQDVPGWCDYAEVYERAVKEAPPGGRLVEVGAWQGQSAIVMARLIKKSGKRLHFYAVDHFEGSEEHHRETPGECEGLREKFELNLEKHGVTDAVQVLPLASVQAAQTFADDSLDFVFLDASHDQSSVEADIAAWLPKVKPGGILAGHDYDFFGVTRAVTATLPGEQIEIRGRSWLYRKTKACDIERALHSRSNGCAVQR